MFKISLLFLTFFCILPVQAETLLTGGIKFNTNSARQELQQTQPEKPDPHLVAIYLKDKNYNENVQYFIKGKISLKDRTLAFFSDSTYAVMYNNDKFHVWYYSSDGKLIYTEKKNSTKFPYKSYKYTVSGKLINMGLRVSEDETFIYTPNGELLAHWYKNKAYNEAGSVIMTRKYSK